MWRKEREERVKTKERKEGKVICTGVKTCVDTEKCL